MSTTKGIDQYPCIGALSGMMREFIALKTASGLKYVRQAYVLDRFSRFACQQFGEHYAMDEQVFQAWRREIGHGKVATQASQCIPVRDFAVYLDSRGYDAYMPTMVADHGTVPSTRKCATPEHDDLYRFLISLGK